jgi:hypothetical protein
VCDNYGPHKKAEDYPSHAAQENAIAAVSAGATNTQAQTTIRHRLQIRRPDYLSNVA